MERKNYKMNFQMDFQNDRQLILSLSNFKSSIDYKGKDSIVCNSMGIEVTLVIIFIVSSVISSAILFQMLVNFAAIILAPNDKMERIISVRRGNFYPHSI